MGKIRVKTLGIEEIEKKQKKELKEKQEKKKTAKTPGLHGGERVVVVGPSKEELEKIAHEEEKANEPEKKEAQKKEKFEKRAKQARSKRYQTAAKLVDKAKVYPLAEALKLLTDRKTSFDETVELHLNTVENGISSTVILPHGTGKKVRVAIANDPATASAQVDLETLIKKIESGNIDFDVLVAYPNAMPKLAKVAKILGPRGLMPNPKNGTITDKPTELIKKYEGGQISFKTEAKAPIIHLVVGKISFGEKKLMDNIKVIIESVKKENIKKTVIKTTMSPGIKIQY